MPSPEEILALSLQPTMQAVNNFAAGQTDMAKLQYLNAVRRSQEAEDFIRNAQQAREMLALHTQAQAEQADRTNRYLSDREDARQRYGEKREDLRQKELTKREDLRQKAMLDRMTAEEKQRTIRGLIVDLSGDAVSRAKGESDDDYIGRLIAATNKRKEDRTAANTKAIGVFDSRISEKQTAIDNILNPEQDPQKQTFLNAEVDRQLLPYLSQQLTARDENNNPIVPDGNKKLKMLTQAIKSGLPIEKSAALAGLGSHLTSARTILKTMLAEQSVTASDKIRLSGLQKDVLQLQGERNRIEHSDPEAARRAAVATAEAILKTDQQKQSPPQKPPGGLPSVVDARPAVVAPSPLNSAPMLRRPMDLFSLPSPQPVQAAPDAPKTAFGGPVITSPEFWTQGGNAVVRGLNRLSDAVVPSWSAFSPQATNAPGVFLPVE